MYCIEFYGQRAYIIKFWIVYPMWESDRNGFFSFLSWRSQNETIDCSTAKINITFNSPVTSRVIILVSKQFDVTRVAQLVPSAEQGRGVDPSVQRDRVSWPGQDRAWSRRHGNTLAWAIRLPGWSWSHHPASNETRGSSRANA